MCTSTHWDVNTYTEIIKNNKNKSYNMISWKLYLLYKGHDKCHNKNNSNNFSPFIVLQCISSNTKLASSSVKSKHRRHKTCNQDQAIFSNISFHTIIESLVQKLKMPPFTSSYNHNSWGKFSVSSRRSKGHSVFFTWTWILIM